MVVAQVVLHFQVATVSVNTSSTILLTETVRKESVVVNFEHRTVSRSLVERAADLTNYSKLKRQFNPKVTPLQSGVPF